MKKWLALCLLSLSSIAAAQTGAVNNHCYLGGTAAVTSGLPSSNYLNGIIPHCLVTVYLTGTTTKATIYSDAASDPLSNPFYANTLNSVNPGGWLFFAAVNQGYDVVMSGGDPPNTYPQPVTLTDIFASSQFVSPGSGCTPISSGGHCVTDNPTAGTTQFIVQQNNTEFGFSDAAFNQRFDFQLPTTSNTGGYADFQFIDGSTFKTDPTASIIVGAGPSAGFNGPMGASIQTWPMGANAPSSATNWGDGLFIGSEYIDEDYLQNQSIDLYSYNGGFVNITASSTSSTPANGINLFGNLGFNVPLNSFNSYTATHTMTWAESGGGVFHSVDATTGSFTVTLPPAAGPGGNAAELLIFWKSTAANSVTIAPGVGDTISGASNPVLTAIGSTLELASDGFSKWYVVGQSGTSGGAVSSVFGRTGAVVATSGDYSVGQVTGAAPAASPTFTGTVTLPATNKFSTVPSSGTCSSSLALDASGNIITTGCAAGGGVSSFAAPSGSWPSWLVPTVTNSTTTPSLAVAASAIPNSALTALAANQVLGALTATTPSGLSLPSCSGASNALIWTSGTGFGCNTIAGASPGGSTYAAQYNAGSGTFGGISGITGAFYRFTNAAAPTAALPGIALGNGGSAVTATTYTFQCDSATSILDRGTFVDFNPTSAATATMPDAGSTGCANNFYLGMEVQGFAVTVNRTTSSTFNIYNGSTLTAGATSFTVNPGQWATLSANGSNWDVHVYASSTGTVTDGAGTTTANQVLLSTATAHQYSVSATLPAATIPAALSGTTSVNGTAIPASATLTRTIASGTAAMGTSAISSGTCASVVTVAATGVATTDTIAYTPNADPTAVTGYGPSATGSLYIWAYPTAGNVNFKACNNTSASITPAALTLNWKVTR